VRSCGVVDRIGRPLNEQSVAWSNSWSHLVQGLIRSPHTIADLRYALMASSWAYEMAEKAGISALNFTALLDDAQAASRNGLSSGDDETVGMPGQL